MMSNVKTGDILNYDYTGAVQTITLPKGKYKLECWGAQGGGIQNNSNLDSSNGGLGGYSVGTLSLTQSASIYIYVGGMGKSIGSGLAQGGFNGGGCAYGSSNSEPGNGGGGATDIRISQDSLYSRVIVAGGGGGAGEDSGDSPGYGGGTSGGTSSGHSTAATQTSTGTGGVFGYGAHTAYDGGGGGGGWYGGGTNGGSQTKPTSNDGNDTSGGCGGSGYVYTSSTAKNYPSGCLLNSSYYLSDAKTVAGNTSFKAPSGSSETGHTKNGYCRITVIECSNETALYGKLNGSMKKATGFYFKLNNKMYGIGNDSTINGDVMNFDYTGSVQTATLTHGTYKLECWGAEGGAGSATQSSSTSTAGGKGGYSTGIIILNSTTNMYIYVGGKGNTKTYNGSYSSVAGGFNGGGENWTCGSGGSGGGGSDIRIASDSLYSRVIVAGGGAGTGWTTKGGSGGGSSGLSNSNTSYCGTQTSGGSAYTSAYNKTPTSGTFGQGGNGSGSSEGGSGGGGGWYGGGGAGYTGGSGGGSGYVYTSSTASNYPSGCLLNSSHYLTSAQTIAGDTSFTSPSGSTETGHTGNGYVRITKLIEKNITYLNTNSNAIMDFNYTGSVQSVTLKAGSYRLECWGAQGGSYGSYIGGYGGYSTGTLTLTQRTTIYIYTGGAGNASSAAGFNGGGTGISSGRGGGGATDIRIGTDSLYARVIVAGGGGGAGVTSASANPCGCGGGEYGGDGYYNNTTGSYTTGYNRCGGSASQTAGGITWSTGTQATFGQGGNASGYSCGGGGGGWYGGGGAYDNDSDSDGRWGGGGSGYVYTSSTVSNYPSGCLLNSSYYLTDAKTVAGNTSFTSPTGTKETGHSGNGFCRITNLNPKQYGIYVKKNGTWTHIDL